MNKYKRIIKSYLLASIVVLFITSSTSGGLCGASLRVRNWSKLDLQKVQGFDVPPDKGPDKGKEPDKPKKLHVGDKDLQDILDCLQDGDESKVKKNELGYGNTKSAFDALISACSRDKETLDQLDEIIKLFISNNININEQDSNGGTPLHQAACLSSDESVNELITKFTANGAKIDIKDNVGKYPFTCHFIAQNGSGYDSDAAKLLTTRTVVQSNIKEICESLRVNTEKKAIDDLLNNITACTIDTGTPKKRVLYEAVVKGCNIDVITAILDKMREEILAKNTNRVDVIEKVLLITAVNGGWCPDGLRTGFEFIHYATGQGVNTISKLNIKPVLSTTLRGVFGGTGLYSTINNVIRDKLEDELADLICNAAP